MTMTVRGKILSKLIPILGIHKIRDIIDLIYIKSNTIQLKRLLIKTKLFLAVYVRHLNLNRSAKLL